MSGKDWEKMKHHMKKKHHHPPPPPPHHHCWFKEYMSRLDFNKVSPEEAKMDMSDKIDEATFHAGFIATLILAVFSFIYLSFLGKLHKSQESFESRMG